MRSKVALTTNRKGLVGWRRWPTSTEATTGWSEVVGDGDGDIHDELDQWQGTGTYWEAVNNAGLFEVSLNNVATAPANPASVDVHCMVREPNSDVDSIQYTIMEGVLIRALGEVIVNWGNVWDNASRNINMSAVVSWADVSIKVNSKVASGTLQVASVLLAEGA